MEVLLIVVISFCLVGYRFDNPTYEDGREVCSVYIPGYVFFYFFYSGVEWLWFLGCYSCYALLVASFTEMHFVTETRFVEFFVILPKGLCGYGCMI